MGNEPFDWNVHEICSEPSVWLTAHLLAHVRYSGHCTFTCTWCVHVNGQWSDSLMCSIIGQWAQWLMCAWKCAVSQFSYSLHIYMHTSDTRVTARLHALDVCMWTCSDSTVWCVHLNGLRTQWPMCASKCAVNQLSDSLHIYMHTSVTRVTARLHAHDVCL